MTSAAEEYLAKLLQDGRYVASVREYVFAPPRKWRFDFAWPQFQVAVEVEGGSFVGGRHGRGPGFAKDCEKYNTATVMGWRVLRVTPRMLADGTAMNFIQELVPYLPLSQRVIA